MIGSNIDEIAYFMRKQKKVYLYSFSADKLTVTEGIVWKAKGEYAKESSRFSSIDKGYDVSDEPGVVFNRTVWLSDRNDKKAMRILVKYERTKIAELRNKIKEHQNLIMVIKEGLE